MDLTLIAPAILAGALAAFSPCGFVMLPALVAVQVREAAATTSSDRVMPVARALRFGAGATVGFVVVFGLLGVALALGARAIASVFPLAALLVGVALLGLGLLGLAGRQVIRLPAALGPRFGRPIAGGLPFGIAYAVASLCYALGMGAVLIGVALAAALSTGALLGAMRVASRWVEEVGSIALTVVGAYLIIYWLPRLAAGA